VTEHDPYLVKMVFTTRKFIRGSAGIVHANLRERFTEKKKKKKGPSETMGVSGQHDLEEGFRFHVKL